MDLEGERELLAEAATSLVIACELWKDRKIHCYCDWDGLQRLLRKKGYIVAIDGDFGRTTETIVKQFQKNRKLGADGSDGPKR